MAPATKYCSECGRATAPDELAQFGDRMVCGYCKQNYAQKLREGVAPVTAVTYAGFWIRFLATIIDGIILAIVQGIVQVAFLGSMIRPSMMRSNPTPEEALSTLAPLMGMIGTVWLITTAIHACYEVFFVGKMGATPGKMALGLKVVRPNGMPVDLPRAFGRYFAKMLSAIILFIGYIMAGFDAEKRALHDMICDTRVVKVR